MTATAGLLAALSIYERIHAARNLYWCLLLSKRYQERYLKYKSMVVNFNWRVDFKDKNELAELATKYWIKYQETEKRIEHYKSLL